MSWFYIKRLRVQRPLYQQFNFMLNENPHLNIYLYTVYVCYV